MKVLVTGAIGFIGFHLTNKLIQNKIDVFGIDNINGYYNVKQKYDKLPLLGIEEETIWPIGSLSNASQWETRSIYKNWRSLGV